MLRKLKSLLLKIRQYYSYIKSLYHKKYLRKYLISKYEHIQQEGKEAKKSPIWILWLQGIQYAPDVVKVCCRSIENYCNDREIIYLDKNNLGNYIQLPSYIKEKYEKGIISHTHYSDIVRVCLLCEYGGTWIDSTVLLTEKIPDKILNADFFIFSSPETSLNYRTHLVSNWFIHSKCKHPFLLNLRESLFNYWEKEVKLVDYFTLHLFFREMINNNPNLLAMWNKLYHMSNVEPHILYNNLAKPLDLTLYEKAKEVTTIHKLTYKIDNLDQNSLFKFLLSMER